MKTLIELFDESPILNVLASVAFKPEKLYFSVQTRCRSKRAAATITAFSRAAAKPGDRIYKCRYGKHR